MTTPSSLFTGNIPRIPLPSFLLQSASSNMVVCRELVVLICLVMISLNDNFVAGNNCVAGTVNDRCVSASGSEEEYFYCTDRYKWEWSQEVSQLPYQASDSLCITMDSDVVDGLDNTEMLVLGGCDADFQTVGEDCSSISTTTHVYEPLTDSFAMGEKMPTVRFRAAAVNVSHHVYLFGGRAANGDLVCTVDRYNAIDRIWETLDVVQENNCYSDHSGVATDDGTIFLFGGYSADYRSHATVVKVEVSGDDIAFSTSTPMNIDRGDHVCSLVPSSTDVYCMGGFTEDDWVYSSLKSVERFDTSSETWEHRSDMVYPRADFGVGHLHGRITVVGGEDEKGPMDDVEWYNPEDDCWTDSGDIFDLPYKRLRYCAATHQSDQRIYIFGGQSLPSPEDGTYTISETVNWYKEVLVDELTTTSAAAALHQGAQLMLTTTFLVAAAQLIIPALYGG